MDKSYIKEILIRFREQYHFEKGELKIAPVLKKVDRTITRFCRDHRKATINTNQEWICDNAYFIKQVTQGLRRKVIRIPLSVLTCCRELLKACQLVVTKEALEAFFQAFGQEGDFTDRHWRHVPDALSFSLTVLCAEATADPQGLAKELITSLHFVKNFDFTFYINGYSSLEQELRRDPSGIYSKMDQASQEQYRTLLKRYAKRKKITPEVACRALNQEAAERSCGLGELLKENTLFFKGYFFSLWVLFFVLLVGTACYLLEKTHFLWSVIIILLSTLSVYQIAKELLHFFISVFTPTNRIFKLRLDACPPEAKTAVCITCLVDSLREIDDYYENLENFFLTQFPNRKPDPNVFFGIIGDLAPACKEIMPRDEQIRAQIEKNCEKLNLKYGGGFFGYLRKREYAQTEGVFCGKERKRGAIAQFSQSFTNKTPCKDIIGDVNAGFKVKYLITLDADTRMDHGQVYRLVGAMLHPCNKPIIRVKHKIAVVVRGHGILQPAVRTDLSSACVSPFSVLNCGAGGREPYASACFDVYQDVFDAGMFCGKGIIDLECYRRVCAQAFPDNAILSHDILEGSRMRAGFLSDESFLDSVPSDTIGFHQRRHRWIRGDVQNLPWAGRFVPDRYNRKAINPAEPVYRHVIRDNVIHALISSSQLILIFLGAFTCGRLAWRACGVLLFCWGLPVILQLLGLIITGQIKRLSRNYYSKVLNCTWTALLQFIKKGFTLACEGIETLDAVLRSLWRMKVSKKRLLAWKTFASRGGQNSLKAHFVHGLSGVLVGLFLLIVSPARPARFFALLWCLYPVLSWRLSKPFKGRVKVNKKQTEFLTKCFHDSFGFYEEYVNSAGHFLPPDNVSYSPASSIAFRTSPTNIGLYLLTLLAARDMEHIDTATLRIRCENTFSTLSKLERFRGHFYNWYDTSTLEVLGDKYVSTVDSGNLAVCLSTFVYGLREYCLEDSGLEKIVSRAKRILEDMDFRFLYDSHRGLFYIGYHTSREMPDSNHYDMYMSEARLTSYYCASKGIVDFSHWRKLSRSMVETRRHIGAASWTGTCFEYFMPTLFFPVFPNSFEDESLRFVYNQQKRFSYSAKKVFGVSESAYFAFDPHMNYQYRAFGVPTLRLKREQESTLVISPYSSFLMLQQNPEEVVDNLIRLKGCGMYGKYGFYEAMDCNLSRTGGSALVKSYMTHHLGMSLISIVNVLQNQRFVKRFCKDDNLRASLGLLEEQIPVDTAIVKPQYPTQNYNLQRTKSAKVQRNRVTGKERVFFYPGQDCSLVASTKGANQLILREAGEGILFHKPYGIYTPGGFRIRLHLSDFVLSSMKEENPPTTLYTFYDHTSHCEITLRYLGVLVCIYYKPFSHRGAGMEIQVRVQGYCGLVLCQVLTDCILSDRQRFEDHPAFSNLFLEGFVIPEESALLIRRKNRDKTQRELFAAMGFAARENQECYYQYGEPAIFQKQNLYTDSPVPFPLVYPQLCFSQRIMINPKAAKTSFQFFVCCAYDAASCRSLFKDTKSNSQHFSERESRKRTRFGTLDTQLQEISGEILYKWLYQKDGRLSLSPTKPYPVEDLWALGISGDLPVYFLDAQNLSSNQLCDLLHVKKIHYLNGVLYDLVFLIPTKGYIREEFDSFIRQVFSTKTGFLLGVKGGIHPIDRNEQTQLLFSAVACQLSEGEETSNSVLAEKTASEQELPEQYTAGRFIEGGYQIDRKGRLSPPWSHVICSKTSGCLVTDRSLGYSWASNSALKRISQWDNDIFSSHLSQSIWLVFSSKKSVDLVKHAQQVCFRPGQAEYQGQIEGIRYSVKVGMDPDFSYQLCQVTLCSPLGIRGRLEYRLKPVLGQNNKGCGALSSRFENETLCFWQNMYRHSFSPTGFVTVMGDGKNNAEPIFYKDSSLALGVKLEISPGFLTKTEFAIGCYHNLSHWKEIKKSLSCNVLERSSAYALALLPPNAGSKNGIFPFWLLDYNLLHCKN